MLGQPFIQDALNAAAPPHDPGTYPFVPERWTQTTSIRGYRAWALTPDELILYMPDYPVGHDVPVNYTTGLPQWSMDGGAVEAHIPLSALSSILRPIRRHRPGRSRAHPPRVAVAEVLRCESPGSRAESPSGSTAIGSTGMASARMGADRARKRIRRRGASWGGPGSASSCSASTGRNMMGELRLVGTRPADPYAAALSAGHCCPVGKRHRGVPTVPADHHRVGGDSVLEATRQQRGLFIAGMEPASVNRAPSGHIGDPGSKTRAIRAGRRIATGHIRRADTD